MKLLYDIVFSLAVACVGVMIGWYLRQWVGKEAMTKIMHRTALLLYAYGVKSSDIKALMEVHLDDDAEVYRLVAKFRSQILRPDAKGGAEKEAMDGGTQGDAA